MRAFMYIAVVGMLATAGCAPVLQEAGSPRGAEAKEGHSAEAAEELEEHHAIPTDAATIARAEHVQVLETATLGCASEALGPVDVHEKMETTDAALHVLKLRAAALGADAVTGVEFEHGEGGKAPTHLAGMAVRCRDMLHGRSYDVIGPVSVRGKMGHEEDAFDDLRKKAASMNANMVLAIKFEHGEADGEGPMVTGTAVHVRD